MVDSQTPMPIHPFTRRNFLVRGAFATVDANGKK
jgi:hypothetical protein